MHTRSKLNWKMDFPVSWNPRVRKSNRDLKNGEIVLRLLRGSDTGISSSSGSSTAQLQSNARKTTLGSAMISLSTAWSGIQAWRRGSKPRGYMVLSCSLLGWLSPYLYTKQTRQSDGEYVGTHRGRSETRHTHV